MGDVNNLYVKLPTVSSSTPCKEKSRKCFDKELSQSLDGSESTMILSKLFSVSTDDSSDSDNLEISLLKSPILPGPVDLSEESTLCPKSTGRLANLTKELSLSHNESTRNILKQAGYSEEDVDSAIFKESSENTDKNPYGRDRPTTHIFSQGKVFTYPKLEVPKQSKLKKQTTKPRVQECCANLPVPDPGVSSLGQANHDHHILASLRSIRIKNLSNVIIGLLNINSLRYKFQALESFIHGNIDVLIITETKIDHTFPQNQFRIPGFRIPYRKDRDAHGGGVMIYVREDIPSDILSKHKMDPKMEAIFIEVNLRKLKYSSLLFIILQVSSIEYQMWSSMIR